MHRIFQSSMRQSERNGTIEIRTWFGSIEVLVDGYTQSGRYLRRMWHQALLRLPKSQKVGRILMLGLGTGSAIRAIHSCYPTAALTIVEWDPVMVELAAKHCCASELNRSTIVLGDVVDVLPNLKHSFDLILIDIYKGQVPEPRLYTRELIEAISACTNPSGQILLNAFQNTELIDTFSRHLDHLSSWRFCTNHLASFATWPPLPLSDDESTPITR